VSQTIGIIAAHAVPEHARLAAGESGIFAITTEELGDIENILHVIATRAAERRRIALET
jgi:hypothetical protein